MAKTSLPVTGELLSEVRCMTSNKRNENVVKHVQKLLLTSVMYKETDNLRQCYENDTSEQSVGAVQETSESFDSRPHSPVVPGLEGSNNEEITAVEPQRSDRPARPCPYCGNFKVRLTRHIKAVHKNEVTVGKMSQTQFDRTACCVQATSANGHYGK